MAVYRQVQTSFWQDDFILSLTPEEKYFYIYLFTNSKTKQCGIYELPLKVAELETGYNRETVIKLIQRFIEFDKIAYDWETKELALKNWMKYNPMRNPLIEKCVQNELSGVKNRLLIDFINTHTNGYSNKNKNKNNNNKNNNKEVGVVDNPKIIKQEYFVDILPIDSKQDFIEAWNEWCDFRREIKKKLTKLSAKKQITFLLNQPDPIKCINTSIQNSWTGLFEDKSNATNTSKQRSQGNNGIGGNHNYVQPEKSKYDYK